MNDLKKIFLTLTICYSTLGGPKAENGFDSACYEDLAQKYWGARPAGHLSNILNGPSSVTRFYYSLKGGRYDWPIQSKIIRPSFKDEQFNNVFIHSEKNARLYVHKGFIMFPDKFKGRSTELVTFGYHISGGALYLGDDNFQNFEIIAETKGKPNILKTGFMSMPEIYSNCFPKKQKVFETGVPYSFVSLSYIKPGHWDMIHMGYRFKGAAHYNSMEISWLYPVKEKPLDAKGSLVNQQSNYTLDELVHTEANTILNRTPNGYIKISELGDMSLKVSIEKDGGKQILRGTPLNGTQLKIPLDTTILKEPIDFVNFYTGINYQSGFAGKSELSVVLPFVTLEDFKDRGFDPEEDLYEQRLDIDILHNGRYKITGGKISLPELSFPPAEPKFTLHATTVDFIDKDNFEIETGMTTSALKSGKSEVGFEGKLKIVEGQLDTLGLTVNKEPGIQLFTSGAYLTSLGASIEDLTTDNWKATGTGTVTLGPEPVPTIGGDEEYAGEFTGTLTIEQNSNISLEGTSTIYGVNLVDPSVWVKSNATDIGVAATAYFGDIFTVDGEFTYNNSRLAAELTGKGTTPSGWGPASNLTFAETTISFSERKPSGFNAEASLNLPIPNGYKVAEAIFGNCSEKKCNTVWETIKGAWDWLAGAFSTSRKPVQNCFTETFRCITSDEVWQHKVAFSIKYQYPENKATYQLSQNSGMFYSWENYLKRPLKSGEGVLIGFTNYQMIDRRDFFGKRSIIKNGPNDEMIVANIDKNQTLIVDLMSPEPFESSSYILKLGGEEFAIPSQENNTELSGTFGDAAYYTWHGEEGKRQMLFIVNPPNGQIVIEMDNINKEGGATLTTYKMVSTPSMLSVTDNTNSRDGAINTSELQINYFIENSDVKTGDVTFYLDKNKKGFDGIKIFTKTFEELKTDGEITFPTDHLEIDDGYYYVQTEINDGYNIPVRSYELSKILIKRDGSPMPVNDLWVDVSYGSIYANWSHENTEELEGFLVELFEDEQRKKSHYTEMVPANYDSLEIKPLANGIPGYISVRPVGKNGLMGPSVNHEKYVLSEFKKPNPIIYAGPEILRVYSGQETKKMLRLFDADFDSPELLADMHELSIEADLSILPYYSTSPTYTFKIQGDIANWVDIQPNGLLTILASNQHVGRHAININAVKKNQNGIVNENISLEIIVQPSGLITKRPELEFLYAPKTFAVYQTPYYYPLMLDFHPEGVSFEIAYSGPASMNILEEAGASYLYFVPSNEDKSDFVIIEAVDENGEVLGAIEYYLTIVEKPTFKSEFIKIDTIAQTQDGFYLYWDGNFPNYIVEKKSAITNKWEFHAEIKGYHSENKSLIDTDSQSKFYRVFGVND